MLAMRRPLAHLVLFAAGLTLALAGPGCGSSKDPLSPGPGVVYSYPFPGQKDVSVGARIIVGFTDPVDEKALTGECTATTGAFCVVGPDGQPLPNVAVAAEPDKTVVHFLSEALQPGTDYDVFVRPALLGGKATNLSDEQPLFSFRTRQSKPIGGEPPSVLTINSEDAGVFAIGEAKTGEPRFPVVDFTGIRVTFSEPIDPDSIREGDTFQFVEVDPATGDTIAAVPGTLLVQGTYVSFDPAADLGDGKNYRLRLSSGIRDLGGEALADSEFAFVPQSTAGDSGRTTQILDTQPSREEAGFELASPTIGRPINRIEEFSPMIGEKVVEFYEGVVVAEMADADAFGPIIPVTIRKGALLRTTGIDIKLGGQLPVGVDTGDLSLTFLSDATGYLVRNLYRPASQVPDDDTSPVYAFLNFDVALTSSDPTGNALLNQTTLNIQSVGTAKVDKGSLSIQVTASTELDLLGVDDPTVQVILGLNLDPESKPPVDTQGPFFTAARPASGEQEFPAGDRLLLTFSEAIDTSKLEAGSITLATAGGTAVPVRVLGNGSTLIVTPVTPLQAGQNFRLSIGSGVVDLAGNPLVPRGDDATGGVNQLDFRTGPISTSRPIPPLVAAIYPGAPCALTAGGADSPGRCASGAGNDDRYAPFELPANQDLEVYFNQPIRQNTLTLGTLCGTGSVRVEIVDGGDICQGTVPGTLLRRERSLRFVPAKPWEVGPIYRLTLVSGGNNNCDAGEICGTNNRPLNPDAVAGLADGEGGGPAMQIRFAAVAAALRETYIPATTSPFSDLNGNGFIDPGEVPTDENRGANLVVGTGGIVSSARFDMPDCVPETSGQSEGCFYLSGSLPVSMGQLETNCTIGQDASGNPRVVDRCIPVKVTPQILYGTSLRLEATLIGIADLTEETGTLVMRVRETPTARNTAYIIDDGTGLKLVMTLNAYLDAPELSILLSSHDLHSKPLTIALEGPVSVTSDGRVKINAANTANIDLRVNIDAPGPNGSIDMRIPAGQLRLQLLGHPQKNAMR